MSATGYIAWHYHLSASDVRGGHAAGREFYTGAGEPLQDIAAIRSAFKRDGVVVSRRR